MDIYSTTNQGSEDQAGKLKLHEVRDLGDDVDEILGKLKPVDYGVQDLEVLIELARTLKHKRLTLFPDTQSILMSDNLALFGGAEADK